MRYTRWALGWMVAICYFLLPTVARAGLLIGSASSIGQAGLDGSNYSTLIPSAGFVFNMAIDPSAGTLYWGDATNPGGTDDVYRANLDGSGKQVLIHTSGFVGGVALDPNAGKLYFGSGYGLYVANLDGSNVQLIGSSYPQYEHLQVYNGKLYWDDINTIKVANLDGTGVQTLVTGQSSITGLDVAGGKMYWVDQVTGEVQSANLDGSSASTIASGYAGARGVIVDTDTNQIYWGQTLGSQGTVWQANLDGSNRTSFSMPSGVDVESLQIVGSSGAAAPEPSGLALLSMATASIAGYFTWRRRARIVMA